MKMIFFNSIDKLILVKLLTAKRQDKTTNTSHWEKEIDQLVYRLYGLTDEEIRIVESK